MITVILSCVVLLLHRYTKEKLDIKKKDCQPDVAPFWYECHSLHGIKESRTEFKPIIVIFDNKKVWDDNFHEILKRYRLNVYQRKTVRGKVAAHVHAGVEWKDMQNVRDMQQRKENAKSGSGSSDTRDSKMENDDDDKDEQEAEQCSSESSSQKTNSSQSQVSSQSSSQGISRHGLGASNSAATVHNMDSDSIGTHSVSNRNRSEYDRMTREELILTLKERDEEIAELSRGNKDLSGKVLRCRKHHLSDLDDPEYGAEPPRQKRRTSPPPPTFSPTF